MMNKVPPRSDDFETRRAPLKDLTDTELKTRFWQRADEIVEPLLRLAKSHTTPSIERSVLLRMGFSDVEAKGIVDLVIDHHLMGKGAGHVVYRYSLIADIPVRDAGIRLLEGLGWEEVVASFEVKRP